MVKVKKYLSKLLVICIVIGFSVYYMSPIAVNAASYSMADYETVIEHINTTYGKNIDIVNLNLFMQNVYNKITPSEFEQILIGNTSQRSNTDHKYNVSDSPSRARNEIVMYKSPISYGNWVSEVSAKIETTFFSDSTPKFIKYIDAGNAWNDKSPNWMFRLHLKNLVSFSDTSCKVSYKGYWMIPLTGVADTAYLTYNITYTP